MSIPESEIENEETISETETPETETHETESSETEHSETEAHEAEPSETEALVAEAVEPVVETSTADDLRLIEALLFAASSPLDEAAIKERLAEGTDVRALMAELTEAYAPRGVNIAVVAGGWTIRTAPDLAPRMKLTQKVGRKLSRAAIETLAVVAYHQPVTRAEIEEIRGVVISKGTLDTLMEAGWIVPKGRKQTVGRPVTWVTTEAFLVHFGLASLSDLPGIDELRATGLIGPRPVATLSETIGIPEGSALPPAPGDNDGGDGEASNGLEEDARAAVLEDTEAEVAKAEEAEEDEDSEDAVEDDEAEDADDEDDDDESDDDDDEAEDESDPDDDKKA